MQDRENIGGLIIMHCWIELSRGALLHNYDLFTRLLGQTHVIPILKSNAYGHGIEEVFQALQERDPPWLGVTYTSEARILRSLQYKGRILNVGPFNKDDLESSFELETELLMDTEDRIQAWIKLSHRPKIHFKIDTGLSRRGFSLEQLKALAPSLLPYKNEIVGIATHFANVEDVTNTNFAQHQIQKLTQAVTYVKEQGFSSLLTHCSSSAAALLIPAAKFDLSRIGISLYGLWPSEKTRLSFFASSKIPSDIYLKPALSWKTKIFSTREINEGDFVGYGCTFKALHKMRIAVVPVGYYEGYPRLSSGRGAYAIVRGRRCSIIGRICMNMMMIELENCPQAEIGDVVTLLGRDANEEVSAEKMGEWADTINYEIVTRLNPAIPKVLKD